MAAESDIGRDPLARLRHELRQPVQSLGLYIATLKRTSDPARIAEIAAKMQGVVDSLAECITTLTQHMPADRSEPVNASELLAQVEAGCAARAAEAGVEIRLDAQPCTLSGDPVWLGQTLSYLAGAYLRAADGGELRLACRVEDAMVCITLESDAAALPATRLDVPLA